MSKAFPLILVYIAAVSVYFKRKVTKICFIVFLALCIIVYMWINIVNPCGRVETIAPFFALLMLGIASAYDNDWKGKDLIVLLLIFSYTITLSLGSDTDISRKTTTLVFVIPLIYVSAKMAKLQAQRILISCMVCIVAVYSMIYFTLPMRNSYADIKYINQTMPVSELGIKQKIKVDPYIYDEIKQLKDAGLSNSSVVLNSSSSWGFVYLLGCKPVSYSFNLYEDKVIESLKKNSFGIKLVLVEEKPEKPFTTEFKDSVAMLFEAKRCEKKETNRHNLYFFYK